MKKIFIVLMIAALLFGVVACKPEAEVKEPELTENEVKDFTSYIGAFGHVRVLGDLDHVMKGDMDGSMKGTMAFNENKTELAIALTLDSYDYDGHKNPEDPNPELYTRIATGDAVLTLVGAMNAEGTGFVANSYKVDLAVALACDNSKYIALELPGMTVEADGLTGRFVSKNGATLSPVTITVADGKAVGVADVNTSSFEMPKTGTVTINGIDADLSDF